MKPEDIVKELWSLANIITGFSIAQSLAFAVALGKNLAELQDQILGVKIVLTIFILIFGAVYTFGVLRCHRLAMSGEKTFLQVWREVTYGRIFAIWLFSLLPIFGLFVKNIFGDQDSPY